MVDKQLIQIKAEIDFNEQIIEERQQVFDKAESIMNNIAEMAEQLKSNTQD